MINSVVVNYGCSDTNQCLTAVDDVNLITAPVLTPPGLTGTLSLNTCGGTKIVTVTNSGATAHGAFMTQTAPTGYIFASASVTGEFNAAVLNVVLGGAPVGRTATIDFTTAAASGATDVDDDRADGLASFDFGMGDSFTITYVLTSDGTELDCLADPTDLDFADPEQLDPTSRSSLGTLSFTNLCGEAGVASGTLSAFPDIPDPDIDLQPNSLILTNGQATAITATIRNNAESGNAENLHIRLRFGTGWTNLVLVSSNVISSGASALTVEFQGTTNVLVDLPGVILDPVDDIVVLNFEATAIQNGGNLDVLAEVVGDCGNPSVIPACTFTNTLGQAPLANTLTGSVVGAVNGQYYGFDQDRFIGAGQSLSKTVRYDDEPAINAGLIRTARVGEDLIYRIEASYFGGIFSNITVTESLPAELLFRDPVNYTFSGAITGATYDAGTGVFILQPSVLLSNPSSFAVEFPVVMSNRLDVQQGAVVTNVVVTDYFLDGVTNTPTPRSTEVPVLEPVLTLAKLVNSNLVQEGNVVIFTNILQHTAGSTTSAYDVVFTDTLPAGLTFSTLDLSTDGMDNDGDGAVDELDEAGLVSGNTITVTTNNTAALYEVAVGQTVTFRFPALVQSQILGAIMTNRAFATYTSLDGVGTNGNERTGTDGPGGLNDYTTNAAVTLTSLPVGAITKTFVSSSQTNTPDFASSNYFTIGERFIYEIRVDVPQGIATNVTLTDSVPALVDWVGGNTNAGLTYPGFGYQFIVPVGGPQFPTTTVEGLVITDPDPTPTSSTSSDGSDDDVVFSFGAITNVADGILTNDFFLLRMEFVALSAGDGLGAIANQVTIRTNLVTVQDSFTNRTAVAPRFFFVEHNIGIAKTRSPATADAGDVVTFTLLVTNLQGGATGGNSSAYDIQIADTLLSNTYDLATLAQVAVPDGWATTNTPVTGGIRYELFTTNTTALAVGARVTNIFTVALAQNVRPSQIYTNRADVTNSTTLYGPPPGGISERNDTANNSVTLTVPGLSLGKALFSTSETNEPPDSLTNSVQIGEVVTYRLAITLPETTITNLSVVDTISSNGLAYVWNSARLDTNAFNGTPGLLGESPTGAGLLAPIGQTMTFTFAGNTTTVGDNDTNNNSFALLLDYLVLDTNLNSGLAPATVHTNLATLTYSGNPGPVVTSGVVNTYVTEPRLGIAKSMTPTNVQGGTVVSFTFVVTNSGSATAYDVAVSDRLNPGYFDTSSISNAVVPTGYVFSVESDTVYVRSDTNAVTGTNTLEVGESITITFDATAAVTFPPNARVTNLVGVAGDSLRSTNIFAVQRPTTSSAPAVLQGLDFNLIKTLYATSETGPVDSTNDLVQIGEVATYQLQVQLPEGTTTNLTFTDVLPLGLSFIMGSVVVDTAALNGTLPAVVVTPDTAPEPAGNGVDITITFPGNTVVTPDGETTNDILRIRFDALVLDTNSNVGLAGSQTVLPNTASVTYDGNPNPPATSQVVNVTVIEPQPRIVKDITPGSGDAGDQVIVTLTITNSGLAAGYDIALTDRVDGVFYDITSISNITAYTGWKFEVETNLPDVTVVYRADNDGYNPPDTTLEPGEAMVFSFAVDLAQTVVPNQIHTNRAGFREVSTILANMAWEERHYTPPEGTDTVSVVGMTLAKSLAGTSETGPVDTTGTNVTIGEVVTYRLLVTLPESTITNLTVTDELPAGMTFFTNVVVDTTGFGGSLPSLPPDVLNMGGSGGDVVFTFNGHTVVTNDNNPANNSFAIEFNALVLNVAGNDGLPTTVDGDGFTILTNRATLTYDGNPSNPVPSGVVNVQVVEPSLLIGKTMTPPTNGVVLMTLVVTNRGAATAFDVVVTDLVRTVWFDTSTLTPVSVPTGFTYSAVGAPGNATVTFASDPASGQPTNSIEVGEAVTFQFSAALIPGASGRITNTAVVATNTTTDGPNPDERVEPPATNTALLELPSFTVTKTRTSPVGRPADVGETVTFRLTVTNTGPVGFSTVELDDTFDNLVLAFASATPGETSVAGGTINWADVGPLPVGRATNVLVSFTALQSTQPGDTTNWVVASLITTNGGPLPPQTSSAPVAVATPSYVLNKELLDPAAGVATQGQAVVFRLSVTNDGEVGLNPVQLVDTFDTNYLGFVSATPGVDSSGVGSLTWTNVGPLAVGGASVVTVRFSAVSSTWPSNTTNVVVSTVSTTNGTPLPPQTSSVPVQVANPDIGLIKLAGAAVDGGIWFTNAGADVVYTYFITNSGDTHLSTMTVTDNVLGVIGTVPGPLAPGGTATILYTSSVPAAVTNIGTVVGTPTDDGGTPIPGLPPVRDEDDAIVHPFASLGNFVWLDVNWNGVQDGGSETGMPGVAVTLYDAQTNALNVTTTDVNGAYAFTNLVPGTYFVGFTPLATYELTQQDLGGDDTTDSDASLLTGYTIPTVLISGENDPTWDAGVFQRASLGDFVWNDLDADGVQDSGETGVVAVVVNLLATNGTLLASTTTDVNGAYAFTNLPPGEYVVDFVPPAGSVISPPNQGGDDTADSDADIVTGQSGIITLVSGENDPTIDAGLYIPASLGDFVWNDLDADGLQDGGETGIVNVVVNLYDTNNVVVGTTTTDVSGAYAFTNLVPGTYYVGFVAPGGYVVSPQDQGGNDGLDSDANTLTGLTIATTLVSGENDPSWDAGYYLPASLGNFVWLDVNWNGVQDGGSETGMPGVAVTLFDAQTNALGVTTTALNGAYAFTNLTPGTYFVGFATPSGYELTQQDAGGDDAMDSDASLLSGYSAPTTLVSGEDDPTLDAGVFQRASLGDFVWNDLDADGVQDGGETGIVNVVVNLYDTNNVVVGTTTTDVSGAYAFTNLVPGTYYVGFVAPGGYAVSPQDQDGNDGLDSDANVGTGLTVATTLVSGENDPTWDAGLYLPASLGNFVWLDVNWNGVQDGGNETGMPGVAVTLYDAQTNALNVTTTDVNGAYAFTNLVPGTYFVGFTPLATYELTQQDLGGDDATDSDASLLTGYTIPTVLISGENDPTWDAGVFQRASLGDFVWNDDNRNGQQDGGSETGMPNVVVNLLATNGTLLASTTTDVNGAYAFTNLPPGEYVVEFGVPSGYEFTIENSGSSLTDSDADTVTGRSGVVVLDSGENDPTIDAGLFTRASIGNLVWLDVNANGLQDGGAETGMPDVVVRLYDIATNVVGITTTDVSGVYSFTNLIPGTYFVGFASPVAYFVSPQDQGGDDALDSDVNPVTSWTVPTQLTGGENDLSWDMGLYLPASLGNFVWLDVNWNGVQDGGVETGMPGVVVNLYDTNDVVVGTTTTDVNGAYAFTNLTPATYYVGFIAPLSYALTQPDLGGDDATDSDAVTGTGLTIPTTLVSGENDPTWDAGVFQRASLGNFVWLDANWNGIQDGGVETGMPGVVVNLYDTNDVVVGTTTTDVSGAYAFTNLAPATYYVGFVAPLSYELTQQDLGGDDATDSDASVVSGLTMETTLISGENDPTWDAGVFQRASLGNFVWNDLNADGVQDGGETGIVNVVVNLYDTNNVVVGTTTTDVSGAYAFTNLVPATYYVGFVVPGGYVVSPQDAGGDDALDSDANVLTGYSIATILVSGENDPTWDAGLYIPASLGDVVWYDFNRDGLQTPGETGVVDVVVRLYDAQTNVVGVTTTGVNGAYAFTNLTPGTYWVAFDTNTLPAAYGVTFQDQGGDDSEDSDANAITGLTIPTVLISGENDPTWDMGIKLNAVGYTLVKTNIAPGPTVAARVGDGITFHITLVNTGAVDLVTVPVEDTYENAYLTYTGSVPATVNNVNDGVINWADVGPLPVGASTTLVVNFTAFASSVGLNRTNSVVSSPTTPTNEPPVPVLTNEAPYRSSSSGYTLAKVRTSPVGRAAQVGETVTFAVTVVNTGDVALVTVPVSDTYETAYLTYTGSVPATVDNVNDGIINWTDVGPLPVGASTTLVVHFTAFATSSGNDRTNVVATAPTTPPGEPPVPPSTNIAPYDISSAGYTLAKVRTSPVGRAAQVGEAVTFAVTVVNTGDVALVTVPVSDTYETAYLTYTGSVPATVDNSNDGTISWTDVGPLPVGASTTLVVNFTAFASSAGVDRTNVVATAPTTPPDAPPVPPTTNSAPYDISSAGYTLAKVRTSPVGRAAQVGEAVIFAVTVVNTGDVALVTIPVEDTYETAYLTYTGSVPATADNVNDGTISWMDVGPLPAGASTTLVVNFTAFASSVGTDRTNVVAPAPTTPPDEPTVPPTTNSAPYATSHAGYTLAKVRTSPAGRAALVGEAVTFAVTVVNTGDVDLVTVPVRDTYEMTYLTYGSSIPATADNANDGVIDWTDVGPLPVGASTTLVVSFTAASSSVGNDRTNVVETAPTTPPNAPPVPPRTNEAPYSIITAGYTLEKTLISATNRFLFWGEEAIFELRVVNTGETDLVSVDVEDQYDPGILTFLVATNASVDLVNDGVLNWTNLGPVAAGATTSIYVHFEVAVNTYGVEYTNVVVATPTTPTNRPPVPVLTNDEPYASTSGSFGDTVWVDVNGDGSPTNENLALFGLNGVVVDLFRIQGGVTSLFATVTTTNNPSNLSENGFYLFTNLPFGVYVGVVNVGTVPPSLTVPTTALLIPGTIGPDSSFQAADFGFLNASATPVELLYFDARSDDGGIRLAWETALEVNTLGYRLHRASAGTPAERSPINAELIAGLGADHGHAYEHLDEGVVTGSEYLYWLEEVATDGQSEWYGPVRVWAGEVVLGEHLAGAVLTTGGLVRVSADALAEVGVPMGQVDPAKVQVVVGGQEVARFVSAEQTVLRSGDYLIFYAPPSEASREVAIRLLETNALDMAWTYARPRSGAGTVGLETVDEPGRARFSIQPENVRTLVSGFTQSSIWALNVTDPGHPSLLYGYNVVPRAGSGEYAVYLSLATNTVAEVIAVQNDRVIELDDLQGE